MDASWAALGWKRRLRRRSALHQKPPVRTHTRFPNACFLKIPTLPYPLNLLNALHSSFFIFKNTVTILLQPHLKTEVIFSQVLIKTQWQCLLSGCTWDQKIPSQQHPPPHMPHLRLGAGQGMPCILSKPQAWKSLFVHKHLDTTSKQAIPT